MDCEQVSRADEEDLYCNEKKKREKKRIAATAKIVVWWDVENCLLPREFDASIFAPRIQTVLASVGLHGSCDIRLVATTKERVKPFIRKKLEDPSSGVSMKSVIEKSIKRTRQCFHVVWWDIENCLLPGDFDASGFALRIMMVLKSVGLVGLCEIRLVDAIKDRVKPLVRKKLEHPSSGISVQFVCIKE